MSRKNPDLCERPYCRERWTVLISGMNEHWHRRWTLHVCDAHAEEYGTGIHRDTGGLNVTTASRREEE